MGNAESTSTGSFPYTIKTPIPTYHSSIGWTLHSGVHTTTNEPVSIFSFDKTKNSTKVECARNGMTLLRQLRHPFVLKYLSSVEQGNMMYIVTEAITPFTLPFVPPYGDYDDITTATAKKTTPLSSGANNNGGLSSKTTGNNYNSNDNSNPTITHSSVLTSSSLDLHLKPLKTHSPESIQLLISAGLYQLYTAAEFINMKAGIVHGGINPSAIFIASNGDWKLGHFDLAFKSNATTPTTKTNTNITNQNNTDAFLNSDNNTNGIDGGGDGTNNNKTNQTTPQQSTFSSVLPTTLGTISLQYRSHYSSQDKSYIPPDVAQNSWKKLETFPIHVIDAYAMAHLLRFLICPPQTMSRSNNNNNNGSGSGTIPPLLLNEYKLYFPNLTPTNTLNPEMTTLLNLPSHSRILQSTYFNNHVIAALTFLDEIHIKSIEEKTAFFTQFSTIYTMFPTSVLRNRIIPQLILAFEVITPKTAGNSFPGILNSTFAVSKVCLPPDEYTHTIVPLIKRLFQSTDLDIRLSLLQSLKEFAQFLTIDMVFNDILPTIIVGITDINPMVRELTIIGLISFFPHFVKVKNGDYDTAYKNLAIISNKVAYDAYNYASSTFSMVSNYLGYNQQQQQQQQGQQNNNNNNDNNDGNTPMTGTSGSSLMSMSSATMKQGVQINANGNNNGGNTQPQQQQSVVQSAHNPYLHTLPSLYLSQIIFPLLINHFPNEILPQIRNSIIITCTSLSSLLPQSLQETLLLTIYAKGMKDNNTQVKLTAFDGLIISLLTSSFTILTLCNKIIPFTCSYIPDKDRDIGTRAIFILQYSLFKIQYQYGAVIHNNQHQNNTNTVGTVGGAPSESHRKNDILSILHQFSTKYPMLQLDLSYMVQQAQSAQFGSHAMAGNVGGSSTGSGSSSSSSSSSSATIVTNGSSSLTPVSLNSPISISPVNQMNSTPATNVNGANNYDDMMMKDMFPDLIKKDIHQNDQKNDTNINNNNSSIDIDGYDDWSSLSSPQPAAVKNTTALGSVNPTNKNNNQHKKNNNTQNNNPSTITRKPKQQNVDLDFELDTPISFQSSPNQHQAKQQQQQQPKIDNNLDIFESFTTQLSPTSQKQQQQQTTTMGNDDWGQFL